MLRPSTLHDAVPDADFAHHMGLRPGDARAFFAPSPHAGDILAERSALIQAFPDRHTAVAPGGVEVLCEFAETVGLPGRGQSASETMRHIGTALEPDVLLLRRGDDAQFRLVAGALCFPSSWSLAEKMGMAMQEIHAVVPGLNAELGAKIDRFLGLMKPGSAWERANWGLSRFSDRNQHTALGLPELSADVPPGEVWLRAEHQLLMPLPRSNGFAFAIRLQIERLDELLQDSGLLEALGRQLQTMPPAMAAYKKIADVRDAIVRWTGV